MSPEFNYLLKVSAEDAQEAKQLTDFIQRIRGVEGLESIVEDVQPIERTELMRIIQDSNNPLVNIPTSTAGEAAQTLGFTDTHIRWLARKGRLTGIKVGRSWILDAESVRNFRRSRLSHNLT